MWFITRLLCMDQGIFMSCGDTIWPKGLLCRSGAPLSLDSLRFRFLYKNACDSQGMSWLACPRLHYLFAAHEHSTSLHVARSRADNRGRIENILSQKKSFAPLGIDRTHLCLYSQ